MNRARLLLVALFQLLVSLQDGSASAAPTLRRVVQLGERVAGITLGEDAFFGLGPLNDRGQLCFSTESETAGKLLVQYSSAAFSVIAQAGAEGPAGGWPSNLWLDAPIGMNASGNVVFSGLLVKVGNNVTGGTYRWEAGDRRLAAVALPGMPSVAEQKFEWAAGPSPTINIRNEIAFVAHVRNSAGRSFYGLFFQDRDGRTRPVVVPDQTVAGGKVITAFQPSINDAGDIAFLMKRNGDALEQPYTLRGGALAPVPTSGIKVPGKFLIGFDGVWVNNANRNVLLAAQLHSLAGHYVGLFLATETKTIPVAVPGQPMPGGGRLLSIQYHGVSAPNDAGQHAFLAYLEDGSTACYRMDANGSLTPLLKSGTTTSLGRIKNLGPGGGGSWGVGLNNLGEVALAVTIEDEPDTLVILKADG
jgi:hypothetical protein